MTKMTHEAICNGIDELFQGGISPWLDPQGRNAVNEFCMNPDFDIEAISGFYDCNPINRLVGAVEGKRYHDALKDMGAIEAAMPARFLESANETGKDYAQFLAALGTIRNALGISEEGPQNALRPGAATLCKRVVEYRESGIRQAQRSIVLNLVSDYLNAFPYSVASIVPKPMWTFSDTNYIGESLSDFFKHQCPTSPHYIEFDPKAVACLVHMKFKNIAFDQIKRAMLHWLTKSFVISISGQGESQKTLLEAKQTSCDEYVAEILSKLSDVLITLDAWSDTDSKAIDCFEISKALTTTYQPAMAAAIKIKKTPTTIKILVDGQAGRSIYSAVNAVRGFR